MPLGTEVDLSQADLVLDGDSASHTQNSGKDPTPILGPCLLWPNGWMDQDGTWYGVGLCDIVLDGDSLSQFSAHVCCGQTAGCIRIPLGTEAGLGPGDIVSDGDLAPPN